MTEIYDGDKTPFNMALEFLMLINGMQKETINARIEGDYFKWLRTLEGIYDLCHFKFKNDKKDIEKILYLITKCETDLKNGYSNNDIFRITISNINDNIRELTRELNDLLYKYELLYPHEREKKTYIEILEGDFK